MIAIVSASVNAAQPPLTAQSAKSALAPASFL
jgi:hypothetical protein